MVAIVPAEGADESAFLTSSESLFISPIELWDGEPTDNLTQSIIPEKIAVTSYVEEQSNYINKTTVDVESSDPIYSSYTKATKFTITDGFYNQSFGRNQTSMYFSAFKGAKTGVADGAQNITEYASTACLRVYVKVPHDMKLTFYMLNNEWSYQNKVVLEVKATGNGNEFTEVIVPLQAFNTAQSIARLGIGAVSEEFNSTSFITTEQALYISHVELWTAPPVGEEPDDEPTNPPSSVTPEKLAVTSYIEEQSGYIDKITVDVDESDPIYSSYSKATKYTITDGFYEQTFGRNQTSIFFAAFKGVKEGIANGGQDISEYSSTACLRVYIKVPHDMKLTFYMLNESWSYQDKVVLDVKATDNGNKFTEVIVPLQNFNTAQTVGRLGIGAAADKFNSDSFITTEQALYISQVELWTAPPVADEPEDEPTPPDDDEPIVPPSTVTPEKLAVTSYRENQNQTYIDMSTVSIDKKSLMYSAFTSATSMTIKEGFYSQDFTTNKRNKTTIYLKSFKGVKEGVADGAQNFADISSTAYIRFFVSVPRTMELNVYLMNGWGQQTLKTVTVTKSSQEGVYTEIQIPLADVLESVRTITQVGIGAVNDVSPDNFIAEGESIFISPIELWSAKPVEYTPAIAPDEYWESLPVLQDNVSYIFNNTGTAFWTNDWNVSSRDRSISITLNALEKRDELYKYFTQYYAVKVTNAEVYYQMKSGNRDITIGLDKKEEARNFESFLKTGYMRLYINAPKAMRLRIGISDDGWRRSYVVVDLNKTEENGGWQEIQIPLKDFYDHQIGAVDFKNIVRVYIESIDTAENATFSEEYFLKENDEVLQFSAVEFWSKTPNEPKEVDIRSYYYSENDNGVILRDSDDVVTVSSTFFAYENTEDIKSLSKVLKTAYHDFSIQKIWSAYVINNEKINSYRLDPYAQVQIMLPAGSATIGNDTKVVRVDEKDGTVENVKVTTEDGYLILNTVGMGDFVFFTGKEGGVTEDETSNNDGTDTDTGNESTDQDSNDEDETVVKVVKVKKKITRPNNWLPWAIGGSVAGVILIGLTVVFIVLKKKKRKVS